jgi:hypothetical protein
VRRLSSTAFQIVATKLFCVSLLSTKIRRAFSLLVDVAKDCPSDLGHLAALEFNFLLS